MFAPWPIVDNEHIPSMDNASLVVVGANLQIKIGLVSEVGICILPHTLKNSTSEQDQPGKTPT